MDCRFKKPLPFDFFLPEYNQCIEYNGQQHYEPYPRFGGQEAFEKTKIRDNIKRNFCSNSNIGLIEISYLDFDNIEALLSNILSLKIV